MFKKWKISVCLMVLMLCALVPCRVKAETISGNIPCSEGEVKYKLDSEGTLTISGVGTVNFEGVGSSEHWGSSKCWGSFWEEHPTVQENTVKVVISEGSSIKVPDKQGIGMFSRFEKMECLYGFDGFDLNEATSLASAFSDCKKLKSINGFTNINASSNFDVTLYSKTLTDISDMFRSCESLEKVAILCTSEVLSRVVGLFSGCSKLNKVKLFIDGNLSSVDFMFYGCRNLEELDLSGGFSMRDAEYHRDVYGYCYSLKQITVGNGASIYLPSYGFYTKPYNTYACWVDEEGKWGEFGTLVTGRRDIYNVAIPYIIFKFHDYSSGNDVEEKIYQGAVAGVRLSCFDGPYKKGYTFDGYFSDSSFTQPIDERIVIDGTTLEMSSYYSYKDEQYLTEGMDIYCKWVPNKYSISYRLNSGTNNSSNPSSYTIESDTITLQNPTRDGYTFTGWYSDSLLKTKVTEIAKGSTEDIILYAGWECNHSVTNLKYYKEPTCCYEGFSGDVYCSTCSQKIGDGSNIPATGKHKTTVHDAREATCTSDGTTGDTYCVTSGLLLESGTVIPKKGHNMNDVRNQKPATCTSEGYTGDKYCSECGNLQESGKELSKISHSWDNGVIKKEATYSEDGLRVYTCSSCGETKNEVLVKLTNCPHETTEVKNVKKSTCTQIGYSGDTYCSDCEVLLSTGSEIAKKDHRWDNGVITKQPTVSEEGVELFTCLDCDTTKESSVPKLVSTEDKNSTTESPNGNTTEGNKGESGKSEGSVSESNKSESNASSTKLIKQAKSKRVKVSNVKSIKGKKVKVSLKKVKGYKYQIKVSTSKKFKKNVKTYTTSKTSYTIKKLKRGKTYYIKARTYKVINGDMVYGKWSSVKKIKIKK